MSLKPLLVSTINALKRDAQDKMKSILKADWIKSDKEKLVISIDKNVYNITFKKMLRHLFFTLFSFCFQIMVV